jgi:hypothetical protein
MRGRFGEVAPEAAAYLRAIADAFYRAPSNEWAEGKLDKVLQTECSRYGVRIDDVTPLGGVPDSVVDPVEHGE